MIPTPARAKPGAPNDNASTSEGKLNFKDGTTITEKEIESILFPAEEGQEVEELDLKGTVIGKNELVKLIQLGVLLRHLDMSGIDAVDDEVIGLFSKCCPNLTNLSLTKSPKVSDGAIKALQKARPAIVIDVSVIKEPSSYKRSLPSIPPVALFQKAALNGKMEDLFPLLSKVAVQVICRELEAPRLKEIMRKQKDVECYVNMLRVLCCEYPAHAFLGKKGVWEKEEEAKPYLEGFKQWVEQTMKQSSHEAETRYELALRVAYKGGVKAGDQDISVIKVMEIASLVVAATKRRVGLQINYKTMNPEFPEEMEEKIAEAWLKLSSAEKPTVASRLLGTLGRSHSDMKVTDVGLGSAQNLSSEMQKLQATIMSIAGKYYDVLRPSSIILYKSSDPSSVEV